MGKKYDDFADAMKDVHKARLDLAVANGGSAQAHITQSNNAKYVADLKAEQAFEDLMDDPKG